LVKEEHMPGSLNEILPEPVSPESEAILMELLKRKMMSSARLAVNLLHAMEARFGPEAREVVREMAEHRAMAPRAEAGDPEADLHDFCDQLDRGCVGSHRWERVIDAPDRVGYLFTRCLHAEVYRELGEPELGWVFCAGDEPAVRAYNPALGFERTQTLMEGDPACDHVFLVAQPDGSA
jgi:hypothetical protein